VAQIEPSGQNAIVVALLNFFVLGCGGYFYIGQKKKAIGGLIFSVVTCGFFPPISPWNWLAAYDGYLIGQKLQNGKAVREHEVGLGFLGGIFGILGAKDE